jgi:hypothetical protein
MKSFKYNNRDTEDEINLIIKNRNKKIAFQQWIFLTLFVIVIIMLSVHVIRQTTYLEFDGYLQTDNMIMRSGDDVYVHHIYCKAGDLASKGDTLYSFVHIRGFNDLEDINTESDVVTQQRSIRLDYNLSLQNAQVLKVRIKELKRELKMLDHNIKLGLANNQKKKELERLLAESEEALKVNQRKSGILGRSLREITSIAQKAQFDSLHYNLVLYRDFELMKEYGLVRYAIAPEEGVVTKVHVPSNSTVLKGESILEIQGFDLYENNVAVMAYVSPREMKHIDRDTRAEVFVNKDVSFMAQVVMLGARAEEIPLELRSNLSKEYVAVVVIFEIEPNQAIPFWALVKGIPVNIRVTRSFKEHNKYAIYDTSEGFFHLKEDYEEFMRNKESKQEETDILPSQKGVN